MKLFATYASSISLLFVLSGPTFAGQSETRVTSPDWSFQDDFEGRKDSNFWTRGRSVNYGQSCPGSNKNGKSLVFDYIPGQPQSGHGWSEKRFELPVNAVQVEMSYDLFIPSNYVRAPGNHKNFVLWSGAYGKSNANISVSSESWPASGGATPSIYIGQDGSNHGHRRVRTTPLLMENNEGEWVRIHAFVNLARADGHYGTFEIFKNGEFIAGNRHPDIESFASRTPTAEHIAYAHRGNYIEQGYLLGWANGGFNERTTFCIDNFSIKANETHKPTASGPMASERPEPPTPR